MDFTLLHETVSAIWDQSTLPALQRFVSRKSLSPGFDPEWEKNGVLELVCEEAAAFGRQLLPAGTYEVLREKGRSPCLFFSIPGSGAFDQIPDASVFF